jgi:Ni/Co efflux regulator RcnB
MPKPNRTLVAVGLVVSVAAVLALTAGSAMAQQSRSEQQRWRDWQRGQAAGAQARSQQGNSVYWNGCCQRGSIKMGTDPDPFIRSQILRDASGFFGGGDQ